MPFIVPCVLQRARNKQLDFISWTNKYPNVNQTVSAYRKLSNDPHCLIALTSNHVDCLRSDYKFNIHFRFVIDM